MRRAGSPMFPYRAQRARNERQALRRWIISKLGGKCIRCGFSDWRALQFDHIDSKNKQERSSGDYGYLKKIVDSNAEGFQLLCANCNWIKRFEESEWSSPELNREVAQKMKVTSLN
jgi:hypothetical protein